MGSSDTHSECREGRMEVESRRMSAFRSAAFLLTVTLLFALPAGAQSYTVLHAFGGSDGRNIGGIVQATDGNFYGTTSQGGAGDNGTVFQMTPSGTLTTLHSFSSIDGAYPYIGLIQGTDGNFYGTTSQGGAGSIGTVFRITPSGTLTTLHSFTGSDGQYPRAGLVQGSDGNFYGTTPSGGYGWGVVFRITPAGALTTLPSFAGRDGQAPGAELVQGSDGNFYGTTMEGGTGDLSLPVIVRAGTVFRITPSGTL